MSQRLLLDVMLGRLARYLRFCGHDAEYALDEGLEADDELTAHTRETERTLLTRDQRLAAQAADAILIESKEIEAQLTEVADAGIELEIASEPTYCGRCNGTLEPLPEGTTRPEHAPDDVDAVWRCQECGQQFWKGSHWEDVRQTLEAIQSSE